MILYTKQTGKDSGLLREYIVARYGQILKYGGSAMSYFSGIKLCKKLAKLTGMPFETILTDIKNEIA